MKKYIISILVALVFMIGVPFMVPKAQAADLSIRDFVNLLITIGVITPDRIPAVNAYLATLDNTSSYTDIATLNSKWKGKTVTTEQTKVNYKIEGYIKYYQSHGGYSGCGTLPDGSISNTPCPPPMLPVVYISQDAGLLDLEDSPEVRNQIVESGIYNGKPVLVADMSKYKGSLFYNWDSDSDFIRVLQNLSVTMDRPTKVLSPLTLKYVFTIQLTGKPLTPIELTSLPLVITDIALAK